MANAKQRTFLLVQVGLAAILVVLALVVFLPDALAGDGDAVAVTVLGVAGIAVAGYAAWRSLRRN